MEVIYKNREHIDMDFSNIHYINSVGAIIDNSLLIYSPDKLTIEIDSIKNAELFKTRNLLYNLFFIICSIPLFYFFFYYDFTVLEKIFVGISIAVSFFLAFKVKNSRYILFIRKLDANFIELEIDNHCKEDALNIVRIVNKKVKEQMR